MSIYEFKTIQLFDNKMVADSKAELSDSDEYILWTETSATQRGGEIHFQHIEKDFIPPKDEALIKTVADRAYGYKISIGNDGHAVVGIKGWKTQEGELVGPDELKDRLLEVF